MYTHFYLEKINFPHNYGVYLHIELDIKPVDILWNAVFLWMSKTTVIDHIFMCINNYFWGEALSGAPLSPIEILVEIGFKT